MALNGIAHKNLTDPQLHELKGASTATAGQVPFADGEGNTAWGDLTPDKIKLTPAEQSAVSADIIIPAAPLDVLGLPGTPSNTMTAAASFTGVNQNTLNISAKINEILDQIASIQSRYLSLASSYNNLLEALKTLGLITVVYPR